MERNRKEELRSLWKQSSKKEYALNREQVESLFAYLEDNIETVGCDHTLSYTASWVKENCPDAADDVLREIREMGGYCDCEVLMNCYEEYLD